MLSDLVRRNRSYRRFDEREQISEEDLRELVDLARLSASGSNMQALRFVLSCSEERNAKIFTCLTWAAYIEDWPGPAPGERPSAYVVVLGDRGNARTPAYDAGIGVQSILLGAVEKGLGGCILAAIDRKALRPALAIPDRFEILLVLALGRPAEEIIIDEVGTDGNIRYWRDEDGRHHVPKRSLDELILLGP